MCDVDGGESHQCVMWMVARVTNADAAHAFPTTDQSGTCVEINECLSSPCRNNATCNDNINAYTCQCLPGFTGRDCETDIDDCASNPCLNNAT